MKRKRKKAFITTKIIPKLVFVTPKGFWGKRVGGVVLLIFGTAVLTSTIWLFLVPKTFFQKECPEVVLREEKKEILKKILLPRLEIELPTEEAKVELGQSELSDSTVFSFSDNDIFAQTGNIIIFGNNNAKTLSKLSLVRKGDKIILFGENKFLEFTVVDFKTVVPGDNSLYETSSEKTLILFSTSNYLKGKRFVVRAKKI